MSNKLFVANLPWTLSESDLRTGFEPYGVRSVQIMTDRETGKSRGFGFVEMESEQAARQAMEALNGMELGGRAVDIKTAHPKPERSQSRPAQTGRDPRPTGSGPHYDPNRPYRPPTRDGNRREFIPTEEPRRGRRRDD